jgi:hypothetical protein
MSRMVRHYRIWNGAAEGGPLEPDQDALDGIGLDLPHSNGVPARKAGAKGMPRCRTESTTSRSRSARPSLPSRNRAGVSSEESPDKQAWWGRRCIAAPGSTGISIILGVTQLYTIRTVDAPDFGLPERGQLTHVSAYGGYFTVL